MLKVIQFGFYMFDVIRY